MILDQLWQRGPEFLGVRYPIICGAMTWISDSELVAAVSRAGAFGSLAAGNLPPKKLEGRRSSEPANSLGNPSPLISSLSPPIMENIFK